MKKGFLVVDIGCYECGVSTMIVGLYKDEATAEKIAKARAHWREGGQATSEVFEIDLLPQDA